MVFRLTFLAAAISVSHPLFAQQVFEGKVTSQSITEPLIDCPRFPRLTDNCSTSSEISVLSAGGTLQARTANGISRIRGNWGPYLLVGGLVGADGTQGAAQAVDTLLLPRRGLVSASAFVSSVISATPTDDPDFGPSTVTLHARGSNLDQFSTAVARVFDHDTNELLLTIDKSDLPPDPNAGRGRTPPLDFVSTQINFDNRLGHSIRFEYEVDGEATGELSGDAYFQAAAFLFVPEPPSGSIAVLGLLPVTAMRRRGNRFGL